MHISGQRLRTQALATRACEALAQPNMPACTHARMHAGACLHKFLHACSHKPASSIFAPACLHANVHARLHHDVQDCMHSDQWLSSTAFMPTCVCATMFVPHQACIQICLSQHDVMHYTVTQVVPSTRQLGIGQFSVDVHRDSSMHMCMDM